MNIVLLLCVAVCLQSFIGSDGADRHAKTSSDSFEYTEGELSKSDGLVKNLLAKLLKEVVHPSKGKKREMKRTKRRRQGGKNHKKCADNERPVWGKWTDWSCCSTTCGKGREIRWRHCVDNCQGVETEMEEKACQLPACGSKLFGFIKL